MALVVSDRVAPGGAVVRTLLIDRPARRNALDPQHLALLCDAIDDAEKTADVRVLVLAGRGKAFCAGWDLGCPFDPVDPDGAVARTMARLRACPLPVIARVEGAAFGAGLELAISADLRVAGAGASFCLPPAKLGIAYAPEGLARLAGLVGTAAARRMTFTAATIGPREALELGLVDRLVDDEDSELTDEMLAGAGSEQVGAEVDALADVLAQMAPLAVRLMKRTFNALEPVIESSLRAQIEAERRALFGSRDAAEGLAAIQSKRAPSFEGR